VILADENFPLGNALLTMTVFLAWFLWIWLLVWVYMDLFRRDDVGIWGKTAWVVFTLFLPYIGVLCYLIVEGKGMADRQNPYRSRSRWSVGRRHARRRSVSTSEKVEAA
jgi:hypothetical protein